MITNLPTPDSLTDVALRLHFSACATLIGFRGAFNAIFPPDDGNDWRNEWIDYLAACQAELQSIYVQIQQSNELALKARICEVSPYLLLSRNDQKLSTTPKDIDFSELRTLDALDLPAAVNAFSTRTLSPRFIQIYDQVRSLRNKIVHLGQLETTFDPESLAHLLVQLYLELWPTRSWLRDRVRYAWPTHESFLYDGKYYSAEMVVMNELWTTFRFFSGKEFKALFGKSKNTRRFLCHECVDAASTRAADGEDKSTWKTAYLSSEGLHLDCLMCGQRLQVERRPCSSNKCKCDVLAADAGEFAGRCHACGGHPNDDDPSGFTEVQL